MTSEEVAVATCKHCGELCYVYQGPKGHEIMCAQGHITLLPQEKIRWGRPIMPPPKYAMVREV